MPDQASQVPGNFPDLRGAKPVSAYDSGTHLALLMRDLVAVGANAAPSLKSMLSLPFALVVLEKQRGSEEGFSFQEHLRLVVTLEQGLAGTPMIGTFDRNGTHTNYGSGEAVRDQDRFVKHALDIAQSKLGISGSFQEVRERPSAAAGAGARDPSARGESPDMGRVRDVMVALYAALVLLMIAYPPWHFSGVRSGVSFSVNKGYHFIGWNGPPAAMIDFAQIFAQAVALFLVFVVLYFLIRAFRR